MATLVITRGLPGSGKTYWARRWVAEDPQHRARVNRDDIRGMLDDGEFIKGVTEPRVIAVRDAAISALLRKGVDVVCDDTNLPQRTARDLFKLARRAHAHFEVKDMTDVDVHTCVERDATRARSVGENVIRDLYARYLKGRSLPLPLSSGEITDADTPAAYVPKPGTPKAALVDIDGTVALMAGRSPFDETRVHEDQPNTPVIDVVRSLHATGHRIVFVSGRTDGCRTDTEKWLTEHIGPWFDGPFMRRAGDSRKDSIVKAELFDQHIRDVYNVACVLDDRNQVVTMWRGLGLTVLQVADGDF